jgi:hypothetical protein
MSIGCPCPTVWGLGSFACKDKTAARRWRNIVHMISYTFSHVLTCSHMLQIDQNYPICNSGPLRFRLLHNIPPSLLQLATLFAQQCNWAAKTCLDLAVQWLGSCNSQATHVITNQTAAQGWCQK